MNILEIMLICLLATIIIECILALILGIRKNDIIYIVLVNILTNPILNLVLNAANEQHTSIQQNVISLLVLETIVFFLEGLIYSKCLNNKSKNGYLISYVLNSFTLLVGLIINLLNMW